MAVDGRVTPPTRATTVVYRYPPLPPRRAWSSRVAFSPVQFVTDCSEYDRHEMLRFRRINLILP